MSRDLGCYRVPVSRGEYRLAPIVAATSVEEATSKATQLGRDLLKRRLPWQPERGVQRPEPDDPRLVVVGEPEFLHLRADH